MKVIYGIGKVKEKFRNPILTVGVFDGVHRGHQKLIKHAVRRAKKINGTPMLMTFYPHPVKVMRPEKYLPYIISLPYRLTLIESLGIRVCIVLKFTKKMAAIAPTRFIQHYLERLIAPKEIIVGEDFSFGFNRRGTVDFLKSQSKEYAFSVKSLKPVLVKSPSRYSGGLAKIGSTLIRYLIAEGRLKEARAYLGRNVSVLGKVMKGDARGRILGFPTINIYPAEEVVPPKGVYAILITIGSRKYEGMANIGVKPTFKPFNRQINIEAHIFSWHKNIYGEHVILEFIKKMREEEIFASRKHLIRQLQKDKSKATGILSSSTSSSFSSLSVSAFRAL
ncbi:MAG: riboflavin biosynthesis protein RibF [Candidatus Omnitrophica bacterium]|nr:riboflavin biosynthesis protein RibF [Candidatus Omnitrophota bacterium]